MIALDARVVIDREAGGPARSASTPHLAIRPYPEEYVTQRQLKDGTPVVLRPIKPEDEPMWHELLAGCSKESIRSRFSALIKQFTHEMATRYCFIDYDREIAIVAEIEEEGRRKLAGVGRLVADANHETAEYAMLGRRPLAGPGLGRHVDRLLPGSRQALGREAHRRRGRQGQPPHVGHLQQPRLHHGGQQEEDVVLVSKDV